MSESPNPEDEARELRMQKLFDDTAGVPSDVERARLAARAEGLVNKERARKGRLVGAWGLALCAAAAVIYLAFAPIRQRATPVATGPALVPPRPHLLQLPLRRAPDSSNGVAANDVDPNDPLVAVFGSDEGDSVDLGPLFADGEGDGRRALLDDTDDAHDTP
jgi:hypothetical protein